MTLDDGYKPTNLERSTAIELEARRLRVTYGVLSQELERDYGREKEIVAAYIAQKRQRAKERTQCRNNSHRGCGS